LYRINVGYSQHDLRRFFSILAFRLLILLTPHEHVDNDSHAVVDPVALHCCTIACADHRRKLFVLLQQMPWLDKSKVVSLVAEMPVQMLANVVDDSEGAVLQIDWCVVVVDPALSRDCYIVAVGRRPCTLQQCSLCCCWRCPACWRVDLRVECALVHSAVPWVASAR